MSSDSETREAVRQILAELIDEDDLCEASLCYQIGQGALVPWVTATSPERRPEVVPQATSSYLCRKAGRAWWLTAEWRRTGEPTMLPMERAAGHLLAALVVWRWPHGRSRARSATPASTARLKIVR